MSCSGQNWSFLWVGGWVCSWRNVRFSWQHKSLVVAPKILNTFLCCFSFYFENYTEEILEKNVKPSRVVIQPLVPPSLPCHSSFLNVIGRCDNLWSNWWLDFMHHSRYIIRYEWWEIDSVMKLQLPYCWWSFLPNISPLRIEQTEVSFVSKLVSFGTAEALCCYITFRYMLYLPHLSERSWRRIEPFMSSWWGTTKVSSWSCIYIGQALVTLEFGINVTGGLLILENSALSFYYGCLSQKILKK